MSTFTLPPWNGPGDIPGDLTLFYQRLKELGDIVNDFDDTIKAYETYKSDLPKISSLVTDLKTAQTAITNLQTELAKIDIATLKNNLEAALNDAKRDLQDAIDQLVADSADGVDIADTLQALKSKNIIKSMKNWVHTAEIFGCNTIDLYDRINFKAAEIDPDSDSKMKKSKVPTAMAGGKNCWVLAEVESDPNPSGKPRSNFACGTIYFCAFDSVDITAVIHVTMSYEKTGVYHAALNVCYTYTPQDGDPVTGSKITFAVRSGTNTQGKLTYYVTAHTTDAPRPFGYAWIFGRNLKRVDATTLNSITNVIIAQESEPGAGEDAACHGNLISGLRTDDFSVDGSAQIDGELGVKSDATIGGDVEITGDLTVKGTTTFTGQINFDFTNTDIVCKSLTAKNASKFQDVLEIAKALTVKAGGADITGDSKITGGLAVSGAATIGAGATVSAGGANITGDTKVTGKAEVTSDLKVGGKAEVTGTLKAGDNATFGANVIVDEAMVIHNNSGAGTALQIDDGAINVPNGHINAPKGTSTFNKVKLLDTLQVPNIEASGSIKAGVSGTSYSGGFDASGNMKAAGKADIGGDATIGGTATVGGILKVDKIISKSTGYDIIQKGSTIVGDVLEKMELRTSDRPTVKQGTTDQSLAYLSDLTTGMQFQRSVTVVVDTAPGNTFLRIPLEDGLTYEFETGDTALLKGRMVKNGTAPNWAGSVYTPHKVYEFNKTAATKWTLKREYTTPPPLQSNGWMEWSWIGYALFTRTGKYDMADVIWNPNNTENPEWSIVDRNQLDGFRLASDQDKIDAHIAIVGTEQADWLDDNPMVAFPEPRPPRVPSIVPNRAYIRNRPIVGLTRLDGGDWDGANRAYDFIVNGGDYDNLNGIGVPPITERPPSQQSVRNVILTIAHGAANKLPAPNADTAYSLKYDTTNKRLLLDTGTQHILLATGSVLP